MSSWEDDHIQTQGECCQKTGRDWNYAAISQGMIWANRKWEKQARILSSGGARPCPHFGFWSSSLQNHVSSVQFRCSVMSDSVTSWISACQASLSITNSQSLLKLISIESVMPSNHLILCHPLVLLPSIFPSIRVFSSESVLPIRCQSIGVSALAAVLLMNI